MADQLNRTLRRQPRLMQLHKDSASRLASLRKAEDEIKRVLTLALPLTLLTGLFKKTQIQDLAVHEPNYTQYRSPPLTPKHRKLHLYQQIYPISQILLHKPDTVENRRVKASVIFSSFVSLSTLAYLSTFLPSNSDNDH